MFREYLLNDIAKLSYGNKFDKNKMTFVNPTVHFVSRTANNNGTSGCVDAIDGVTPYPAGSLTLAFGGSIGSCFVQDKPFYTGQNVGVIELPDSVSEKAKVYLATVISKVCKTRFITFADEINKHFKTDLTITLPCTQNGSPDWNYMDECVRGLEETCLKNLDVYLKIAGLYDCELTDEEKRSVDVAHSKNVKWCQFRIGDLFEPLKVGFVGKGQKIGSATKEPDEEHCIPLTCAKIGDNGIMYWGKRGDFITYTNALSVIADGAVSAGLVYAQPEEAGAYSHSYFIRVKDIDVSKYTNMYLSTVLTKVIYPKYSREDTPRWNKIEHEVISLPVTTSGSPDWDFMEKYIRATEKLVITDVVKWKNKQIELTKKVVNQEVS